MGAAKYILSLDAGTTSSRAALFDASGALVALAQREFPQYYPAPGWVEHDPEELWRSQAGAAADALATAGAKPGDVAAVGIANQRETVIVWDRATGAPVHNAIVWQCRRTADVCRTLAEGGYAPMIAERTGLVPDPYFSGTKAAWILDRVPGARERAEAGELCFGTVDTWLIHKLTGGASHITDITNASRTMLFNINTLAWDDDMCALLRVPRAVLPSVTDGCGTLAVCARIPGLEAVAGVPITGVSGDQSAALVGQCRFDAGGAKCTYGTGCFLLANIGSAPVRSGSGLLCSPAYSLPSTGGGRQIAYALEGSAFNAGTAIKWLRDSLGLIATAGECDILAASVPDTGGAVFVPAFTGLGAPYWDPDARGLLCGLTRATGKAHICRAVLEGIACEVCDLVSAMNADLATRGGALGVIAADGGASVSDPLMQMQADLSGIPVEVPAMTESTALGAAFLAGLGCGFFSGTDELRSLRRVARRYEPSMTQARREAMLARWHDAVERSRGCANGAPA
jgi:glycerol kinase